MTNYLEVDTEIIYYININRQTFVNLLKVQLVWLTLILLLMIIIILWQGYI